MAFSSARGASLVLALTALLAASPCAAKSVRVGNDSPPITLDIPDSWEVTQIARGIQAKTADEEVFLWFETFAPAQAPTVAKEHEKYFADQGVSITGAAESRILEESGAVVRVTSFPATYEGKPTVLRYISVEPGDPAKKRLLVSYWASPEGDKQYDPDTQRIINSFRRSVTGN